LSSLPTTVIESRSCSADPYACSALADSPGGRCRRDERFDKHFVSRCAIGLATK
jgi:hypothetical protein